jgi:geranylgeranyl diphosphate synthase, type I
MPGAQSFTELLSSVRTAVDRRLMEIWDAELRRNAALGAPVSKPLEAARALSSRGGKRLRAALVAVGHRMGGGQEAQSVLDVCCAVELLQAYFLIHDDWMDGDRVRRGGPAVHAALEPEFGSAHLAAAGAVLAGDFAVALAARVLSSAHLPEVSWPRVLHRFAQMQLDAVLGQQLDVLGDGRDLEQVYRLKTGSYTVLGPLQLGIECSPQAATSGETLLALEAVAAPLGVAFQLRDDLIGAFADTAVTGKPRGGDLRAGKRTMLVDVALARPQSDAARLVSAVLGEADASDAEVDRALAALDACGAREDVERRIAVLQAAAAAAIESGPWGVEARELLSGLSRALLDRAS